MKRGQPVGYIFQHPRLPGRVLYGIAKETGDGYHVRGMVESNNLGELGSAFEGALPTFNRNFRR